MTLTGGPGAGFICRMNFPVPARLLPVAAAVALSACSSTPDTGVTRVKIYRLDPDQRITAVDPSIPFEQKHLLFGAVSNAEREARRGTYFTFFWTAADRESPVTLRLEYRQSATGFQIHSQEQTVDDVKLSNVTRFEVTGEEFRTRGRLLGWRLQMLQGGRVVAEKKSFLWD